MGSPDRLSLSDRLVNSITPSENINQTDYNKYKNKIVIVPAASVKKKNPDNRANSNSKQQQFSINNKRVSLG